MGRLLFNAIKNTAITLLGMGVLSIFLMLLMAFLMMNNILGNVGAVGLVVVIVFIIWLIQGWSEREGM